MWREPLLVVLRTFDLDAHVLGAPTAGGAADVVGRLPGRAHSETADDRPLRVRTVASSRASLMRTRNAGHRVAIAIWPHETARGRP